MYHFYTLLLCFRGYRNETLVWSELEKFRSDKYYRHLCNGTVFKIRHNAIFIILKGQKRNLHPIDLVALFLSKQALQSLIFMKDFIIVKAFWPIFRFFICHPKLTLTIVRKSAGEGADYDSKIC